MKQCNKCLIIKELTEFHNAGSYKGKIYLAVMCKECDSIRKKSPEMKAKQKKVRSTEQYRAARRDYRKVPSVLEKQRIHERKYLKNRPLMRAKKNLRSRLRSALIVKKWFKTTKFYDYIGCNQDELKNYLESKFTDGMTWEKYGENGWELDHIIPLSSAKTEEEMYKLCHYTNLQPLWAADNNAKSDKLPEQLVTDKQTDELVPITTLSNQLIPSPIQLTEEQSKQHKIILRKFFK